MKILSQLYLMLAVVGLYADADSAKDVQAPKASNMHSDENPSGDWSITADVLCWYLAQQTGTDWASSVPHTTVSTLEINELTFPWSWGFRVGAGYNTKHDNWTTQLLYTWYQTSSHDSSSTGNVNSSFEASDLAHLGFPFQRGSIKWGFSFNMFDWDLGRRFYASKAVSLRPFLGIKGGWINQKIDTDWVHLDLTATENLKNNFWGVGPKGGVEGKWEWGKVSRFSIFTVGEGAYLWGHWTFRDVFKDSTPFTSVLVLPKSHFGGVMMRGQMGLGWDTPFNNHKSHFTVRLSYEGQIWFDQLQFLTFLLGPMHQNLTLQGATLNLRVDY